MEKTMKMSTWNIRPLVQCGPFRFGMSEEETAAIAGPFADAPRIDNDTLSGWFTDQPILSADFIQNKLACIEVDPFELSCLMFGETDLLTLPTLEVVALLEKENAGIRRAQGGSLYFEDIGLALLQFETSGARTVMMWASAHDHREPLADVTYDITAKYYRDQRRQGKWPETDLFGEAQSAFVED